MVTPRRPHKPRGSRGRVTPGRVADPARTHLTRSYAQKLRTRELSPQSMGDRAAFWAKLTAQEESYEKEMETEAQSVMAQPPIKAGNQIKSATLPSATLENAPALPADYGITVAGIGQGGIVPPPPPAL